MIKPKEKSEMLLKVKIVLVVILTFSLISCGSKSHDTNTINLSTKSDQSLTSKNCTYNHVEINAYEVGTDKLLDSKKLDYCFSVNEKDMGLVEISNPKGNIKVLYYKEQNPNNIKYLDIKLGEGVSKWRKKNGHDLFIVNKNDDLTFVFGDRKKSKIKGTVKFTR